MWGTPRFYCLSLSNSETNIFCSVFPLTKIEFGKGKKGDEKDNNST
jgi:hypothetical protein